MAENESAADYGCQEYFKEAVCIDAQRVYDSCSDKDCIEDIRVLFPAARQSLVDSATNVRVREVNVITVYIDLQPIPFNKGFYSVDMTFFFDVAPGPVRGHGLLPGACKRGGHLQQKGHPLRQRGQREAVCLWLLHRRAGARDCRVLPKATVQVAQPWPSPPACATTPPAAASLLPHPRGICQRYGGDFDACTPKTRCMSPLACSPLCRLCATCKCSSPPTISACRKRSAWPPATTPASCSGASTSPPTSSSPPRPPTCPAAAGSTPLTRRPQRSIMFAS